jgi:hypothetical protein
VRIFTDFLGGVQFEGATFLDLGPGQYDFGEMARARGAITHGIDNDPAVIELGEYKGFPVKSGRLQNIKVTDFAVTQFDGIFCKFSINAFWFYDDNAAHANHLLELGKLLKPEGWAWIAPWNGVPKKSELGPVDIEKVLLTQAAVFKDLGFIGVDLSKEYSEYYGVHGNTANRALFLYNLSLPTKLKNCKRL